MMTPTSHACMTATRAILTNLGLRATTGKIKVPKSTAARLAKAHEATQLFRTIGGLLMCLSFSLSLAFRGWSRLLGRGVRRVGVRRRALDATSRMLGQQMEHNLRLEL